jgi:hypothetical protein
MSMSVTGWTEWSEEPTVGMRLGAHNEEVLQGRTSFTTQQSDKAVGIVVPDIGISIMPVIDVKLPVEAGWKTFSGQQPDKVVGTTPMGARHSIVRTPNTGTFDHDYDGRVITWRSWHIRKFQEVWGLETEWRWRGCPGGSIPCC